MLQIYVLEECAQGCLTKPVMDVPVYSKAVSPGAVDFFFIYICVLMAIHTAVRQVQ